MTIEDTETDIWVAWVARYTPYPSEIRRYGFDVMIDNITDALFNEQNALVQKWGDFGISGQQDKFIEIEIVEDQIKDRVVTIGEFQDDLAAFLGSEGYQGNIVVARQSVVTRMIVTDEDPL